MNSHAKKLIFLTPFLANKIEFFVHITTRRLDSILELCQTFLNVAIYYNFSGLLYLCQNSKHNV